MPIVTKQKKWGPEYVQAAEPVKVRDGMTWYDTANNELKVWDESSSSWRWAATGSGARFGYVCGGIMAPYFTGIQRIDFPFSAAVAWQVGNIETSKNSYSAGCNSSQYGFVIGGLGPSLTVSLSSIRRFDFPFQSGIAEVVGNASQKHSSTGCNSSQHGYSIAGSSHELYTACISSIDRITFPFSSGTASVVGNIITARGRGSAVNSSQHGYSMGGFYVVEVPYGQYSVSYVDRILFPFNSGTSTQNARLSFPTSNSSSFNSSQYAYTTGINTSPTSSINRFSFPFDSGIASIVGSLAQSTYFSGALNSTRKGYVCGGSVSSTTVDFQTVDFSFDSGTAEERGVMSSEQVRPTCIDGVDFVTQFI